MNIIDQNLLRKAIEVFGEEPQYIMAFEECGEFVASLAQWLRGREVDVIGEVADVLIIMQQVRIMLGPEVVDERIQQKLERLGERIQRHQTNEQVLRRLSLGLRLPPHQTDVPQD